MVCFLTHARLPVTHARLPGIPRARCCVRPQLGNISAFANVCLAPSANASLVAAAEEAGYDVDGMVDSTLHFNPINFTQYGNVTQQVEEARLEAALAWVS